jgi:hypothetical protein
MEDDGGAIVTRVDLFRICMILVNRFKGCVL